MTDREISLPFTLNDVNLVDQRKNIVLAMNIPGYLKFMEIQPLNWHLSFRYPGMVRIGTMADGSCYFHCIAQSYHVPYQRGNVGGVAFNRKNFIRDLRYDLSVKLGEKVDPTDPNSPIHYDLLSRGQLKDFGKEVPNYSLVAMQRELNSDRSVDNVYNEFISNILDKDIYILDLTTQDVYVTGNDSDILYKNRNSIVILFLPGHYELVGIKTPKGIDTYFAPDHAFIQAIRQRLREKISS